MYMCVSPRAVITLEGRVWLPTDVGSPPPRPPNKHADGADLVLAEYPRAHSVARRFGERTTSTSRRPEIHGAVFTGRWRESVTDVAIPRTPEFTHDLIGRQADVTLDVMVCSAERHLAAPLVTELVMFEVAVGDGISTVALTP
jgi:hypothetical protein